MKYFLSIVIVILSLSSTAQNLEWDKRMLKSDGQIVPLTEWENYFQGNESRDPSYLMQILLCAYTEVYGDSDQISIYESKTWSVLNTMVLTLKKEEGYWEEQHKDVLSTISTYL